MRKTTLCAAVLALTSCISAPQVEVKPPIPVVDIPTALPEQESEIEDTESDKNPVIDAYPLKFNIKSKGVGNNKTIQYLVLNEEQYDLVVFELEQINLGNTIYWDLARWFQCPNFIKVSDEYRFNCWPRNPDAPLAREMARKTDNLFSKYRRDKETIIGQDYLNGFSSLMKYQGPNNYCPDELDDDFDVCNWGTEVMIDFL